MGEDAAETRAARGSVRVGSPLHPLPTQGLGLSICKIIIKSFMVVFKILGNNPHGYLLNIFFWLILVLLNIFEEDYITIIDDGKLVPLVINGE